jgi:pilus assembly protein CpaB
MKNKKLILLALLLAAVTSALVYLYLENIKKTARLDTWKRVLVAAKDIPARTEISPDLLREMDFPADFVHPLAIETRENALGKVTLSPIHTGEFLLSPQLALPTDPKHGLPYQLTPGTRAISIAVDEIIGIAELLNPGDRVDVLTTINIATSFDQKEKTYTIVAVQDVEVLAAGKRMDEIRIEGKTPAVEIKTVTLAVTAEQALPLTLASEKGFIRLALRSPVDHDKVSLPPYQLTDLLQIPN